MIEREWFIPAFALTLTACVIVMLRMPDDAYMIPALGILPAWMVASAIVASLIGFVRIYRSGEQSPVQAIRSELARDWKVPASLALTSALAGLNLIGYAWFKPLLNMTVPFSADPMLARIDNFLFFGHDPWRLVSWANVPFSELLYHPGWMMTLIVTLVATARAPASPQKSAALVTYFVLWTAVAPIIHTMMPAAGPLFYQDLGYGPRFAGLHANPGTKMLHDFLWSNYVDGCRADGNGISSMPSMHMASAAWAVIAIFACNRRWMPLIVPIYLMLFVLSVALGWHYAVDGIVGSLAALATYRVLLAEFKRIARARQTRRADLAVVAA